MKKTKLIGLAALLLTLGVVGCGEGGEEETPACEHDFTTPKTSVKATCKTAGEKVKTCKLCGYEEKETIAIDANAHSWVADAASDKAATCSVAGVSGSKKCELCGEKKAGTATATTAHSYATYTGTDAQYAKQDYTCTAAGYHYEECSVCHNMNKVDDPAAHKYVATTISEKSATASKVEKRICSSCGDTHVVIDAMSYTKADKGTGSEWGNKDTTGATLKMSKNGNYVEYEFEMPSGIDLTDCQVALYGWVDYWKDGSINNDQKGHIVKDAATFSLTVNGTAVAVTNTQSFEQMGMTAGENGNGCFWLCPLGGTATVSAGSVKVVYTRVDSYNLNISEIHFYKAAA